MNKHGQTLILFVILIPIILMLLGLIVDTGLVFSKRIQMKEVVKTAIKDDLNDNDISKMLKKNGISVDKLEINRDKGIEVKNEIKVKSIFGSIIGLKEYTIKINVRGTVLNGKMVFE